MRKKSAHSDMELAGLNGGHPLGFLAAVGVLRMGAATNPNEDVRLSWRRGGGWRPCLHFATPLNRVDFVERLHEGLRRMARHPAFSLGDDLEAAPSTFHKYSEQAAQCASEDRTLSDFAAAFGCDGVAEEKGGKVVIQVSDFRTMSGSGHQHFLKFLRNIVVRTEPSHLEKALFESWRYDDPVENQTMRWDPLDDQRYALRWRNPSGDPLRRRRGAMLGANRLAIEALPLFPTAPVGRKLKTTGFHGESGRDCRWTWPIWSAKLSPDVVRSVLSLKDLQMLPGAAVDGSEASNAEQRQRQKLRALGIVAVFRSRRLTIGKYRNFSPAHAL